jgi:hypothetical protein
MSAAQSQPIAITPDDIRTVKLLSLVRHLSHNATISLTETVEKYVSILCISRGHTTFVLCVKYANLPFVSFALVHPVRICLRKRNGKCCTSALSEAEHSLLE